LDGKFHGYDRWGIVDWWWGFGTTSQYDLLVKYRVVVEFGD
jgi:hypothetical protein